MGRNKSTDAIPSEDVVKPSVKKFLVKHMNLEKATALVNKYNMTCSTEGYINPPQVQAAMGLNAVFTSSDITFRVIFNGVSHENNWTLVGECTTVQSNDIATVLAS